MTSTVILIIVLVALFALLIFAEFKKAQYFRKQREDVEFLRNLLSKTGGWTHEPKKTRKRK